MITNENIANNICAERNRTRLTQEEVANKIGISRDVYANIENNRKIISAKELYEISKALNCKVEAFYLLPNTTICVKEG